MTDAEILRMKLNLADCAPDDKGKEDFLAKTDNFHDVFSDLIYLFKVLQKYGLKISPHKCQFCKKKIVCMGLEF